MLRAGKARPQDSVQPPGNPVGGAAKDGSDGSDCEDRVPVPVFQSSFGDAIQKALDSYSTPGRCRHRVNLVQCRCVKLCKPVGYFVSPKFVEPPNFSLDVLQWHMVSQLSAYFNSADATIHMYSFQN